MRRPLSFGYRNLVFGRDPDDAWALYRLELRPYAGLSRARKRELLADLAGLAYALEADFSLLRVARAWSVDDYREGCERGCDSRHAHPELLRAHLDQHARAFGAGEPQRPEVYLSVSLDRPDAGPVDRRGWGSLIDEARRLLGLREAAGVSARRLEALLGQERTVAQRVEGYLDCEPAAGHELQWLVRRAFCRAVCEPRVDERFRPQALVVEAPERDGGLAYRPLEADLLRLMDAPIEVGPRSLRIESEPGSSHQAVLCLGALPEEVPFPSRRAELLFAPLEALPFPVDAALHARHVANREAVRLVRRRIVDADHLYTEQVMGDHGPTADAARRPRAARELEEYLTGAERPPLLRAQVSLCVAAGSEGELEERVERVRREYAPVELHRPLGDQLALFCSHLPAQRAAVPHYDDYLTVEQFGATVPVATHAVGSEAGPYIGHTLSGSRQAVLFDPTEASRTARAPACLLAGTLGSGKTLLLQLIAYQAFLQGSVVCDIDPKGDHRLERLPGVAERMEAVELSGDDACRGMLDPLRIAPPETREDLAAGFLLSVLPEPVRPEWRTELRLAVQTVAAGGGRSCERVVRELESGSPAAREAARALSVHAAAGIARLGFAPATGAVDEAGSRQVTSLRIRNLTLPLPGIARSELSEEERLGQALLRLLAVYALRLTSADPARHAVLGFDEAWVLLADSSGRALVDRISRLGRAQNVTPLLATQVLDDAHELEGLIGALFCFGVETAAEAEVALRLLHLDADDERLRRQLTSFRTGRCLHRDYQGRVGPMQVDLVDPELLAALDTTPRAASAEEPVETVREGSRAVEEAAA
jgi:AAA-like domain